MDTPKPIILIPLPRHESTKRYAIGFDYVHALTRAGGNPLLLPVCADERDLRHIYELADGVLLAGGADCDPDLFGEPRHEKTCGIDADRDTAEILLAQWALADDKSLFGICRGMQIMNVAAGGSLIQDIPSQWNTQLEHQGGDWAKRDQFLHTVCVEPGTRMSAIMDTDEIGVNSFHHQSVRETGAGYRVSSRASDGVIESFEHVYRSFAVGVQWHPENLAEGNSKMQTLFDEFVALCCY